MSPAVKLAELILRFGRVNRATYHPDGVRPESDTDHTVMLGVLACALAAKWRHLSLNVGRVAEFALVHDLAEAYAGDTQSFDITAEAKADKEAREVAAFARIAREFAAHFPWLVGTLGAYEAQKEPEARFVRYLDKVTPKLTHALNGGVAFRQMGKSAEDVWVVHQAQIDKLAAEYPEFADTVGVILGNACNESERAYIGAS